MVDTHIEFHKVKEKKDYDCVTLLKKENVPVLVLRVVGNAKLSAPPAGKVTHKDLDPVKLHALKMRHS